MEQVKFINNKANARLAKIFSERMIAKYGETRWAEMVKEVEARENEEKVIIRGSDLLNHSVVALVMTGNSYTGEFDKIVEEKTEENKLSVAKVRNVINFHSPAILEAVKMVGHNDFTLEGIAKDFENTLKFENVKVSDEWLKNVKFAIINHWLIDDIEAALAANFK